MTIHLFIVNQGYKDLAKVKLSNLGHIIWVKYFLCHTCFTNKGSKQCKYLLLDLFFSEKHLHIVNRSKIESFWHCNCNLCLFRLSFSEDAKSHWLQETDENLFSVLLKLEALHPQSVFGHLNCASSGYLPERKQSHTGCKRKMKICFACCLNWRRCSQNLCLDISIAHLQI